MNKYDELLTELWDLEEYFNEIMIYLKDCESNFQDSYKYNYISILFDFYNNTKDFYETTDEVCDTNNKSDINLLMKDYKNFLDSYSKLLKFFEFAEVKQPDNLWRVFNHWKNKYWDINED